MLNDFQVGLNIAVSWSNQDFTSCEIDHSGCSCRSGRHIVSQICQAKSPDKNLGATDPRAPVSREPVYISPFFLTFLDHFLAQGRPVF